MNKLLEYKGYHAAIDFSADDSLFVGKVIGVTDSLNFHGTSVTELEEMFHQSVDNYLDFCKEIGKVPDKEYKGSFNVRISPSLHKDIAIKAIDEGLTLNQYVERALQCSLQPVVSSQPQIVYLPLEFLCSYNAADILSVTLRNYKGTNEKLLLSGDVNYGIN